MRSRTADPALAADPTACFQRRKHGAKENQAVRIMSLNGWGGRLHEKLTGYLREAAPDVLCLQEVVHTPAAARDWLDYRDGAHGLPQRADFLGDVRAALPEHIAIFCPAARGELWDGETPVPSFWGLATFVRSSLPIVGQAQGFVHKAFAPHGYGVHPRSRSAHAVRLFDFESGIAVCVAHMHGLRDPAGKMDTPERLAQARRLAALVEAVAEPGDRLVVCGDFNVRPDSATFAVLGRLGLADLVAARGFEDTRTSHYGKPERHADYMLVNGLVEFADFTVVAEPEVSDHRPLILDI